MILEQEGNGLSACSAKSELALSSHFTPSALAISPDIIIFAKCTAAYLNQRVRRLQFELR